MEKIEEMFVMKIKECPANLYDRKCQKNCINLQTRTS